MGKEIVKYDNFMNTLNFNQFTSTDLDFLMCLCTKMKNQDVNEMVFTFEQIINSTNYTVANMGRFVKDLVRMNNRLMKVTCALETEEEILMFVLFPTFIINKEEQILRVCVNEKFKFVLNEISKNFTRFELEEFVQLESKYSKNLYRLLKQYRRTGTYRVDVEEFKRLMDCPKSYKNKYFWDECVKTAVKELTEKSYFKDLSVQPIKARKKGSPVVAYEFTFAKSEQIPGQASFHDTESFDAYTKTVCKPTPKKSKNKFNDFQQNQYSKEEWNSLEDELCEN